MLLHLKQQKDVSDRSLHSLIKLLNMAAKKADIKKPGNKLKHLSFLVGKWHTEGEILKTPSSPFSPIKGMDTYEWINDGFFLLHRVDVFMGDTRTEVIEIIGYDSNKKSYFMQSFDNKGELATMYATLEKSGVFKIVDNKMRSTLSVNKNGNHMMAKWERSEDGKKWIPWMDVKLTK